MSACETSWLPGLVLVLALAALPATAGEPRAQLNVEPTQANVGDQLRATLTVVLPPEATLEDRELTERFGPFTVVHGAWAAAEPVENGVRWTWNGTLSAYRTGEFEIPEISLGVRRGDTIEPVSTSPLTIRIESLLDEETNGEEAPTLADLKPPASLPAEYGPLWTALGLVALLLLAAAVLWWLQRRYGSRFAAVEAPHDPFHRMPPHVWIYAELQKLLERRLDEKGQVDLFFEELSRIVKRYLSGRYRIDLMERTTDEVPGALIQAAAAEDAVGLVAVLLRGADQVKFARQRPGSVDCRAAVEQAYRIVDRTRPAEAKSSASGGEAA